MPGAVMATGVALDHEMEVRVLPGQLHARLAQLAEAPASRAGCCRFDSGVAHPATTQLVDGACLIRRCGEVRFLGGRRCWSCNATRCAAGLSPRC